MHCASVVVVAVLVVVRVVVVVVVVVAVVVVDVHVPHMAGHNLRVAFTADSNPKL